MDLEEFDFEAHRLSKPDEFAPFAARIKRLATIGGVIGTVAGVCFCIVCLFAVGFRLKVRIIILPIAWGCGASAMVTGFALLFAPDEFFRSEKGLEYMRAVGTRSTRSARIAVSIALFLGFLACIFFIYLAMKIVGIL